MCLPFGVRGNADRDRLVSVSPTDFPAMLEASATPIALHTSVEPSSVEPSSAEPSFTGTSSGELRRYAAGRVGSHRHAFAQVLFGRRGCLDLDLEGRACRVDADTGLVIPVGRRHEFESRFGAELVVFDVPPGRGLDRIRVFRSSIDRVARSPSADWLDAIGVGRRVLRRRRIDATAFARVVEASLHDEWPTARMASFHALSVAQFHARWRALTGLAPQAWLRRRRLDAAIRRLATGATLERVAVEVGYRTGSALATALRRERDFRVGERRRVDIPHR